MAQEIQIKSYYQSVRDSNFIDTNLCCKFGLEYFLSELLFKGDLSKIIYSKEDIAFRRRLELLGNGSVQNNVYNYTTLDLPFAVYSQAGPLEEDDRGATQNASQIVLGQWQPYEGVIVKSAAVKVKYSATAFFSRRDDVNIASQLLYWEKTPTFPLYYVIQHELVGIPMDIPVFITLDSIDSNVEYQEKQWLEQSKIFPIKMEFTIRSYQTLIEDVDGRIKLPLRFSGQFAYNDEEIVFTQKTSLIWSNDKFGDDLIEKEKKEYYLPPKFVRDETGKLTYKPFNKVSDQYFDRINQSIKFVNDGKFIEDSFIKAETTGDTIEGYFSVERDCVLDEIFIDEESLTENSATLKWKIKQSDEPYFNKILLTIPNLLREEITDISKTSIMINNLNPASKYECTVIVYSKNNSKLTYKLTINTKGQKALGKLSDQLVGKTFTI